jgi:hypothetical protein
MDRKILSKGVKKFHFHGTTLFHGICVKRYRLVTDKPSFDNKRFKNGNNRLALPTQVTFKRTLRRDVLVFGITGSQQPGSLCIPYLPLFSVIVLRF